MKLKPLAALAAVISIAYASGVGSQFERGSRSARSNTREASHSRKLPSLPHPVVFEANQGQAAPNVSYLARGPGYSLYLYPTQAVMTFFRSGSTGRFSKEKPNIGGSAVTMALLGAREDPRVVGAGKVNGTANYLLGRNPAGWKKSIPFFSNVRHEGVYHGIDLVYHGGKGLEYDFIVSPGADPTIIRLEFRGQKSLRIDRAGDLILTTNQGEIRQRRPVLYQVKNGRRQPVEGRFIKHNNVIGFEVGRYDPSSPLVIDPTITYSTFLGGSGDDEARAVAVDSAGYIYVAGITSSTDFPSSEPGSSPVLQDGNSGAIDTFVAKLSQDGTSLIYRTYLGGRDNDEASGIALDEKGSVHIIGTTGSDDFPRGSRTLRDTFVRVQCENDSSGADPTDIDPGKVCSDAFFSKLSPDGSSLEYSTYIGGADYDFGVAVDVDSNGNAYLTGDTYSADFLTTAGAFQPVSPDGGAGPCLGGRAVSQKCSTTYVNKIDTTKNGPQSMQYSTFLGGARGDSAAAIKVDESGSAHLVGSTRSQNFPSPNGFSTTKAGEAEVPDAFFSRLSPDGSRLLYSTYLGGGGADSGKGIALDSSGSVWAIGGTRSDNFPLTASPLQGQRGGGHDLFVAKLSPARSGASSLLYSSYLGAPGDEFTGGLDLDRCDQVFAVWESNRDVRVSKIDTEGVGYELTLGSTGSLNDSEFAIAADLANGTDVVVVGTTSSPAFPVEKGLQGTKSQGFDAFISRVSDASNACQADLSVGIAGAPGDILAGNDAVYSAVVTNSGPRPVKGATLSHTWPDSLSVKSFGATSGSCRNASSPSKLLCDLGEIPPGQSETATVRLKTGTAGVFTVGVAVAGDLPDSNPANNLASHEIKVVLPAAEEVEQADTPVVPPSDSLPAPLTRPAADLGGGLLSSPGPEGSRLLPPVPPSSPGGPPAPAPLSQAMPVSTLTAQPLIGASTAISSSQSPVPLSSHHPVHAIAAQAEAGERTDPAPAPRYGMVAYSGPFSVLFLSLAAPIIFLGCISVRGSRFSEHSAFERERDPQPAVQSA